MYPPLQFDQVFSPDDYVNIMDQLRKVYGKA